MFTADQVAQRYSVTVHTVLGWIRAGELRAVNVGRKPGAGKPRWRISEAAIEAFEAARAATPQPVVKRARVKKGGGDGVVKFYQ